MMSGMVSINPLPIHIIVAGCELTVVVQCCSTSSTLEVVVGVALAVAVKGGGSNNSR